MKSVGWATLISLSVHGALGWAVLRAPAGWFGASHPIEPISVEIIESPVEIQPEAQPEEPTPPEPTPLPPPPPEDVAPQQVAASLTPRLGLPGPIDPAEPTTSGTAASAMSLTTSIATRWRISGSSPK